MRRKADNVQQLEHAPVMTDVPPGIVAAGTTTACHCHRCLPLLLTIRTGAEAPITVRVLDTDVLQATASGAAGGATAAAPSRSCCKTTATAPSCRLPPHFCCSMHTSLVLNFT